MDFLQLSGKTILVLGLANRKSVAWHAGSLLREAGARVLWSVRSEERRASVSKLLGPDEPIFVCDVERQDEIDRLRDEVARAARRPCTGSSTRSPMPITRSAGVRFIRCPARPSCRRSTSPVTR